MGGVRFGVLGAIGTLVQPTSMGTSRNGRCEVPNHWVGVVALLHDITSMGTSRNGRCELHTRDCLQYIVSEYFNGDLPEWEV